MATTTDKKQEDRREVFLTKREKVLFLLATLFFVLCLILSFWKTTLFWRSYWPLYLLWSGLSLGALPVLMISLVTGGDWGNTLWPYLRAMMKTFPLVVILFFPSLLGMEDLFFWSRTTEGAVHVHYKKLYFNPPFFMMRSLLYFFLWGGLIYLFLKPFHFNLGLFTFDRPRAQKFGAIGLICFVFISSFAGVDWVMSLNPAWHSTIFPLFYVLGKTLFALAFSIFLLWFLHRKDPELFGPFTSPKTYHDLGNLLFAFVFLWGYFGFSQFLITWYANKPTEANWYLLRMGGGYQVATFLLIIFHFFFPFLILLFRGVKRKRSGIGWVALLLLVMRFLDMVWQITPALDLPFKDFLLMAAPIMVFMGALFMGVLFRELRKYPETWKDSKEILLEGTQGGEKGGGQAW